MSRGRPGFTCSRNDVVTREETGGTVPWGDWGSRDSVCPWTGRSPPQWTVRSTRCSKTIGEMRNGEFQILELVGGQPNPRPTDLPTYWQLRLQFRTTQVRSASDLRSDGGGTVALAPEPRVRRRGQECWIGEPGNGVIQRRYRRHFHRSGIPRRQMPPAREGDDQCIDASRMTFR